MSNIPTVAPLTQSVGVPYPRCGATLHIQQTPCRCVEPEDHSGQHRITYGGLNIVWNTTWVVSER